MLNALHTGRTAPKCRVQHYIVCGPVCHSGLRRLLHTQRVVQVQPQVLEAVDLGDNQADDRPFIVLTETKFSLRCIPVWIGTLLTGLGSKKTHVIMFSP